jgi:hypothetical protein
MKPWLSLILTTAMFGSTAPAFEAGSEVAVSCRTRGIFLGHATLISSNSNQIVVTSRGDTYTLSAADTILNEPKMAAGASVEMGTTPKPEPVATGASAHPATPSVSASNLVSIIAANVPANGTPKERLTAILKELEDRMPVEKRNTYAGRLCIAEAFTLVNGTPKQKQEFAELRHFLETHAEVGNAPRGTFSLFQFPTWAFKTGDTNEAVVIVDVENNYKVVEMGGSKYTGSWQRLRPIPAGSTARQNSSH